MRKINSKDKSIIISILFCFIYFFRQAIAYFFYSSSNTNMYYFVVGNFDFFYLLAFLFIFDKKNIFTKKNIIFILLMCFLIAIQLFFIDDLIIYRMLINFFKIIMCYFVFLNLKDKVNNFSILTFVKTYGLLCFVFLILSFIFKNGILWTHNDIINRFDLTRLRFLFTEPSELGLHSSIVLIIAVYLFLTSKLKKERKSILLSILFIAISMYFSKSLGGIGIGVLSIGIMILYFLKNSNIKWRTKFLIYLLLVSIGLLSIPFITSSGMYKRVVNTFTSIDYSNNYRLFVPVRVSYHSFINTNGIGLGLGNAETMNNVIKYKKYGLSQAGVINSYLNFISEGGAIALGIVLYIIICLVKKSLQDKSPLKLGLSVFIIIFQFMGTYFTNPLCWIVYAFIIYYNLEKEQVIKND